MILNLNPEDDELPRFTLAVVYGENIEPIRVCAEAPLEYDQHEYSNAPFALYDDKTPITVATSLLIKQMLSMVESPRVDVLLIDGTDGVRVIAKQTNLALVIDSGVVQLFKGN